MLPLMDFSYWGECERSTNGVIVFILRPLQET